HCVSSSRQPPVASLTPASRPFTLNPRRLSVPPRPVEAAMRKLLPALVAGLVLTPTEAARAQADEARAIVERAVKAMGGLDNLTRAKAAHCRSRGRYPVDGFAFTSESFSEPDRIKLVTHSQDNAN